MIARSLVAVHAARMALEADAEEDVEGSVQIAVSYSLPQTATDTPPSIVKVIAIHKQSWAMIEHMGDERWQQVMEEEDPAKRVALADELEFDDENLSRLITQTLSSEDSDPRQVGLAVAMFLKYSDSRELDPSAFEPLAQLSHHILEPRVIKYNMQQNSPEANTWEEIIAWLDAQINRTDSPVFRLQRNYVLYGFPEFWRRDNWKVMLKQFTEDLATFGITEEQD